MKNQPDLSLKHVVNPVLDRRPKVFLRDPAIWYGNGKMLCFHTTVEEDEPGQRRLFLDLSETDDLVKWTTRRLSPSPLNFSSPGNLFEADGEYVLCLQSYPITPGELWANDTCRLYLMRSKDLLTWSEPEQLVIDRENPAWSASPRKIDPFVVRHDGQWYCLYKTEGKFGILRSDDLKSWHEFTDRPILTSKEMPDGATIENPALLPDGQGGWILFISPCRPGRGIGIARSRNLVDWDDIRYLDLPVPAWAKNGISAGMVLDLRESGGDYLMAFHGEDSEHSHSAALGFARSADLIHWEMP